MSDDWKVGDLAVCVDATPCRCGCQCPSSLKEGRVYEVTEVFCEDGCWKLRLSGVHAYRSHLGGGAGAYRFRKIRPDEPKACEEEFKILLQLSKPRVSAYMMGGKR